MRLRTLVGIIVALLAVVAVAYLSSQNRELLDDRFQLTSQTTIPVYGAILLAFLLGFVPGYVGSYILKMLGLLRVGEAAEIKGLDPTKVPNSAYPEGINPSATPAE